MRRVLMLSIGYGELGGVGTVTKELTEALHTRGDYEVDVLSYWPWHRENARAPFTFRASNGNERPYDTLDHFARTETGTYDLVQFHNQIFSDPYLRMVPETTLTLDDLLTRYNAPSAMLTHSVALRQAMHERAAWNNTQVEAQKQVMQRVDSIIHLTEEQREYVDDVLPEFAQKSCVIGNGTHPGQHVSTEEVSAFRAHHPDKKIGLYLGRISNEKGIYELLEAAAQVKRAQPDFKLLVAGNKDERSTQTLREHCSRHGLHEGDDIDFLGWIDGREKATATQAADFVILPSHYEHFPMALLESMSLGTPCIVSDVPGPRSIFSLHDADRRSALPIHKAGNVQSISHAINYALKNNHDMRQIAIRAQKLVEERYTWDTIAARYHELYNNLRERHAGVTQEDTASSRPQVGIVVPTYNRKDKVTGTIDSLLEQDYPGTTKIVVVDDGSIDGTFEHLQKHYAHELDSTEDHLLGDRTIHKGTDGRIILVRQRNQHVSAARNTGLRILHGLGCDYFTHQDSGDLALPNKVRTLVDYLEKHPQHHIVHATAHDAKTQEDRNYHENTFFKTHWAHAHNATTYSDRVAKGDAYIHNQTTLWRRSVIDKLGLDNLFWEKLKRGNDMDFYMKIARSGFTFGFDTTPVAVVVNEPDALAITPRVEPYTIARTILDQGLYKKPAPLDALRILAITRKLAEAPHPNIAHKEIFSMRFNSLFSLTFSRNFALQTGDLARALMLAEEIVKHHPTEENLAAVHDIERRIRDSAH